MTGNRNRTPPGTPRGGQFTAGEHSEPDRVLLSWDRQRARKPADGHARPLSRAELDEFVGRALATFRGDQAASDAVRLLQELADTYALGGDR